MEALHASRRSGKSDNPPSTSHTVAIGNKVAQTQKINIVEMKTKIYPDMSLLFCIIIQLYIIL